MLPQGSQDFAQAYVLAHEIGHHVQHLMGTDRRVREAQQQNPRQANQLQVLMELQADCLAGAWGANAVETALGGPRVLDRGVGQDAVAQVEDVPGPTRSLVEDPSRAALGGIPRSEQRRRIGAGGADGVVFHLREDRRHITERDVRLLRETVRGKLDFELSTDPDIKGYAYEYSDGMNTALQAYDELHLETRRLLEEGQGLPAPLGLLEEAGEPGVHVLE